MSVAAHGSTWILASLARNPLAWLWVTVSAAAWPAVLHLAPISLTGGIGLERGLIYEVAFGGLLMGSLLGATLLERGAWFLASQTPWRRLALELGTLTATSVALAVPSLLLPLLAGRTELLRPEELPARALLCHLHLCGLVLVLLRLPLSTPLRLSGLILIVWLLPALSDPATFAGRFADAVFAAGHTLVPGPESVLADPLWKVRLAPIIGLVGAALLMRPPTPLHALRHPR